MAVEKLASDCLLCVYPPTREKECCQGDHLWIISPVAQSRIGAGTASMSEGIPAASMSGSSRPKNDIVLGTFLPSNRGHLGVPADGLPHQPILPQYDRKRNSVCIDVTMRGASHPQAQTPTCACHASARTQSYPQKSDARFLQYTRPGTFPTDVKEQCEVEIAQMYNDRSTHSHQFTHPSAHTSMHISTRDLRT